MISIILILSIYYFQFHTCYPSVSLTMDTLQLQLSDYCYGNKWHTQEIFDKKWSIITKCNAISFRESIPSDYILSLSPVIGTSLIISYMLCVMCHTLTSYFSLNLEMATWNQTSAYVHSVYSMTGVNVRESFSSFTVKKSEWFSLRSIMLHAT